MSDSVEIKIVEDALRLSDLNRSIIKAIVEGQTGGLFELLKNYSELKKKIKITILDYPVIRVQHPVAKEILEKVATGRLLQSDKVIRNLLDLQDDPASDVDDDLDFDEIEELRDVLYSWFSHYEYVRGLYAIGALVVGITVPEHLWSYVSEARNCYAFQQYNAVLSLCRTILEAAVRDHCGRKGHFKKFQGNVTDFDSYKPRELIRRASSGFLREKINDLYTETSNVIHGRKVIDRETAKATFRETMWTVHRLYS
jgi:hypothetical protein